MIPENWAEKPPLPPGWGKISWLQIYPFQAILSNFGFCGRKAPPTRWGKFFDFRSIHFRQFQAILVLWQKSPPPPQDEGKHFDFRSIHSRQFQAILVFCGRKTPLPPGWGKFFDFRSIHFRQFWATLVYVAEKPPIPRMREIFWLQIFGFCGLYHTGRIPMVPYYKSILRFLLSEYLL